MKTLREKQRAEILNRDKDNSMEIRRRVQRQALLTKIEPDDGANSVRDDIEAQADNLSLKLNDVLEAKAYNLELRLQKAIEPKGATKDTNIRILLINNDFVNAFNQLAKLNQQTGFDQPTREYIDKKIQENEELINACAYGYNRFFEELSGDHDTYVKKLAPHVFQARTLYLFVQQMFKSKNIKPIHDRDLKAFQSKQFSELDAAQKEVILVKDRASAFSKNVLTDYQAALKKQNEIYQNIYNRDLSPDEEAEFRNVHFGRSNYDGTQPI